MKISPIADIFPAFGVTYFRCTRQNPWEKSITVFITGRGVGHALNRERKKRNLNKIEADLWDRASTFQFKNA